MMCRVCLVSKPDDEFAFKNKAIGRRQNICRPCLRAQSKAHYLANKGIYYARNKRAVKRAGEMIRKAKDVPCTDCGDRFHYAAMDFDHLPGRGKRFLLSSVKDSGPTVSVLMAEMKKCEVVCANCHRVRTFNRLKR